MSRTRWSVLGVLSASLLLAAALVLEMGFGSGISTRAASAAHWLGSAFPAQSLDRQDLQPQFAYGQLPLSFEANKARDHHQTTATATPSGAAPQVTTNTWDLENRLRRVALPSGIVDSFAYDADGVRIQKVDSVGITNYLLEGQSVVEELDASLKVKTSLRDTGGGTGSTAAPALRFTHP